MEVEKLMEEEGVEKEAEKEMETMAQKWVVAYEGEVACGWKVSKEIALVHYTDVFSFLQQNEHYKLYLFCSLISLEAQPL